MDELSRSLSLGSKILEHKTGNLMVSFPLFLKLRGARKAVAKVKNKQWEPKKVAYLKTLREKATSNACVVCGDNRPFVLQKHHADPEKKSVVTLCANCHDTVRRGTLEDLIKANKRNAK
jgi:cytochrome c553